MWTIPAVSVTCLTHLSIACTWQGHWRTTIEISIIHFTSAVVSMHVKGGSYILSNQSWRSVDALMSMEGVFLGRAERSHTDSSSPALVSTILYTQAFFSSMSSEHKSVWITISLKAYHAERWMVGKTTSLTVLSCNLTCCNWNSKWRGPSTQLSLTLTSNQHG